MADRDLSLAAFTEGTLAANLLKGVLYQEENPRLWAALIKQQNRVSDFVVKLGLKLVIDDSRNYAYLRSLSDDEFPQDIQLPPRLLSRRQLSYPVSVLLILLRKRMIESESREGGSRTVVTLDDMVSAMKIYLPSNGNEVKFAAQIEMYLKKICELGFARELKGSETSKELKRYEVRRVLQAFCDAQHIADFDAKLLQYKETKMKPLE